MVCYNKRILKLNKSFGNTRECKKGFQQDLPKSDTCVNLAKHKVKPLIIYPHFFSIVLTDFDRQNYHFPPVPNLPWTAFQNVDFINTLFFIMVTRIKATSHPGRGLSMGLTPSPPPSCKKVNGCKTQKGNKESRMDIKDTTTARKEKIQNI